jgi:hypothetical protein
VRSSGPVEDFAAAGPEEERYLRPEAAAIWQALVGTIPCRRVNSPRPDHRTRIDPFGANERLGAERAGVSVPRTILTSHVADALDFFDAAKGHVVARQGFGVGSVIEGTRAEIAEMTSQGPVSMTALPAGERATAFVCGGRATVARSGDDGVQQLDELRSRRLAARCVRLTRSLGLEFAELSLVEDVDGVLHCLALDAMPELDSASEPLRDRVVADVAELLATPLEPVAR